MKPRFLLGLLALVIFSGIISCNSRFNCPPCFSPPTPLVLRIKSSVDSTDLIYNGFYHADTIAIYYFDNNLKKRVNLAVYNDSIKEAAFIESGELGWVSSGGNKTFYLYLNAADTDTLFLDLSEAHDECCTFFKWNCFEINGNNVEYDNLNYWYNYFK